MVALKRWLNPSCGKIINWCCQCPWEGIILAGLSFVFFLFSLFALISIGLYFWGIKYGNNLNPNTADLIVTYTGVLLALMTGVGALAVWWLRGKAREVEEIKKKTGGINRLIVIAAEIAISPLPLFETKHISYIYKEILESIKNAFDIEDIKKSVDETGNGAKLRVAVAAYHFSKGNYEECKRVLEEIIKLRDIERRYRQWALERLGIVYRYQGDWEKSINWFKELEKPF